MKYIGLNLSRIKVLWKWALVQIPLAIVISRNLYFSLPCLTLSGGDAVYVSNGTHVVSYTRRGQEVEAILGQVRIKPRLYQCYITYPLY